MQLERPGDASAAAGDALAHSGLDAFSRRTAHRILAQIAVKDAESTAGTEASTRSWRRAESHFTECTSTDYGLRADPHDVWNLIHVQLNLGDHARAAATLSSHNPKVGSKYEAELWARVFVTQAGDAAAFAQALDLADRFDDDPQFSGALLSAVIFKTRDEGQEPATPADTRPGLASDLRARAFAALGSHAERHGDASPFKIIQAPGGPEELLAKMTEIVRQDHGPLLDLLEMIRQGRAPLGVLSTMLGHPYSSTLAQRGLGYFIAAAGNDADDAADESAAAAARNGDVVADISALLVSSVLGEFDYARGQFRTLLSPTACGHDITAGRRRLDGWSASSGSVSYDPARDSAVPRGPDIDGHLAALDRFAKLELALSRTQLTSAPPLSSLGEPAIEGAEAWLAPVALAKERGLCLWSDDATQRNLARACGVSAFGTVTLQQLRAAERLDAEDADDAACAAALAARRSEVMTALGERVVDVPADAETLIEQARREGWSDPGLAAATVGRAVWWTLTPTPWRDLQATSRRGPGGLRARRSVAGDGDMGRQCARAGRPRPYGRPDRVRLPHRELAPRPRRSCCRHAPRWFRRGRPEESSASCRLPGSGSNRTGGRRCPGRPAGFRHPDTRAPEPGTRRSCGQHERLTASRSRSWSPHQQRRTPAGSFGALSEDLLCVRLTARYLAR